MNDPREREDEALAESLADSNRHAERMRKNHEHYMAELAAKTSHQCRWHRCFEQSTEGGLCVKHNVRRWD